MDLDDYRIIIPVKGDSERAPEKNSLLLRWTLEYVRRLGLQNKAAVLSRHDGYLFEASSQGITAVVESQNYPDQIPALHQVISDLKWSEKWIILLQPTQPLRQHWLLQRCLETLRCHPDHLVTTCSLRAGRNFIFTDTGSGSYTTSLADQPSLSAAIFAAHASVFLAHDDHVSLWEQNPVRFVKHKYPANLDFDYPEDMISAPIITPSVFDLFYYSQK